MNPEHGQSDLEGIEIQPEATETPADQELQTDLETTYFSSEILAKRDRQNARGEAFSIAFTDIDNSFYRPDRVAISKDLGARAESLSYPIVAVTGNDYAGVLKRIESGELPPFEMIIGSVGTEIWVRQAETNAYHKDRAYEKKLEDSGYHRPQVAELVSQFMSAVNAAEPGFQVEYQNPVVELSYLQTADHSEVQPFKISCFFYAGSEGEVANLTQLANEKFPDQALVVCEEIGYNSRLEPGDQRKKYNLDVLPITKAGAVAYACSLLDVKKGLVAGDSGNDSDMLIDSGTLAAVVVGGAKSELVQAVNTQAPTEKPASFRKVTNEHGQTKAYYVERDSSRLGPDSIAHAAEVLLRAERIAQARSR